MHVTDNYVYCSPCAPILSIDHLYLPTGNSEDAIPFEVEDLSTNPERELLSQEASTAIHTFVNGLSPKEQKIVNDVFWQGHPQASVARELGVSRMAICKALTRIKKLGKVALAAFEGYAFAN